MLSDSVFYQTVDRIIQYHILYPLFQNYDHIFMPQFVFINEDREKVKEMNIFKYYIVSWIWQFYIQVITMCHT